MRAILLAAGIGSRLRPLTNNIPKCLMPIKGQPLLGVWLGHLSQANIGPFLINTHYLADQVESFIEASNYKNQVTLVNEPNLEGTAGTLIKNINFFEKDHIYKINGEPVKYSVTRLLHKYQKGFYISKTLCQIDF